MNALIADPSADAVRADQHLSTWAMELEPQPDCTNPPRAKILYAEDDASLRRAGQLILTREGYSVITVPDGAEAFSALHLDHYDLLITDNNMPRLSGLELIRKLALARIEIPTLMASGSVTDLVEEELRQIRRRSAVLPKPFSPDSLIATVNSLLESMSKASSTLGPGRFGSTLVSARPHPYSRWGINE